MKSWRGIIYGQIDSPFSFRRLPSERGMYLKIMDISERKGNIMTKKKKYGKVQVKNFKDLRIPSSDNHYICDVLCTADRCDAYNIIYKMGWI